MHNQPLSLATVALTHAWGDCFYIQFKFQNGVRVVIGDAADGFALATKGQEI